MTAAHPGRVVGQDEFGDPFALETDSLVLVTMREAAADLYHDLIRNQERLTGAGIQAVYRVGDALSPRALAEAMFDGHRLAREFESADPAIPLRYKREP